MSETKATPGPWHFVEKVTPKIGQTVPDWLVVHSDYGEQVAYCYSPGDAHLIAAAPDLLAACKRVINVLEGLEVLDDPHAAYTLGKPTVDAIRAALAKAEGVDR